MSDHKELCEALRSAQLRGRLTVTCMKAADVIEQQAYDLSGRDALIETQAARIAKLVSSVEFSQRRLGQLSKLQSTMREPERTIVCDILANGFLLNPPIPADRYTAKPDARIAELEAQVMAQRIDNARSQ